MNECGQCEFLGCDLCVEVWRRALREAPGVNERRIGVSSLVTVEQGFLEARNPAWNSFEPAEIGRYVCGNRHDDTGESCLEAGIKKANLACLRKCERMSAEQPGKNKVTMLQRCVFPWGMVT